MFEIGTQKNRISLILGSQDTMYRPRTVTAALDILRNESRKAETAQMGSRIFTRHRNFDGSLGGFVEQTAHVDPTVFMGPKTLVMGNAVLSGTVELLHYAIVCDNAKVTTVAPHGIAKIGGNVIVGGATDVTAVHVELYGSLWLSDLTKIEGSKIMSGNAWIIQNKIIWMK